jgi:hypothetical protein
MVQAAVELGQNGLGGFRPDEGFGVGIVFGKISIAAYGSGSSSGSSSSVTKFN